MTMVAKTSRYEVRGSAAVAPEIQQQIIRKAAAQDEVELNEATWDVEVESVDDRSLTSFESEVVAITRTTTVESTTRWLEVAL